MVDAPTATLIAAILAMVGVLVGQVVIVVLAVLAGLRWRREQSLGLVRWAAELAADRDEAKATLGVETLIALGKSPLFHKKDQIILDAALAVAVQGHDGVSHSAYTDEELDVRETSVEEGDGSGGGPARDTP